jgi:phosphoglycolate phosphatase-like HAD superfamily hydrolase
MVINYSEKTRQSTVIALDVDGILTDFDAHWRQCAERVLGRSVQQMNEDYDLRVRYALTWREVDAVWTAYHADEWHRQPLFSDAADLILALEDLGCEVWAVTSIDHCHHEARSASLSGLIPPGRIVCVGLEDKCDALHDLGAVALLDDHPANVNAALDSVTLPVLLDRGYRGLETPEHGVTVIDDVMDFPVLVEQMLCQCYS